MEILFFIEIHKHLSLKTFSISKKLQKIVKSLINCII